MTEVTFLMAVHNGLPFIQDSIASLIAQTDPSWQLLVVDDASTDDTLAHVEGLRDSRISVMAISENVGQTRALNIGLGAIRTTWTTRLDADDLASPERVAHIRQYLRGSPREVLIGTSAYYIDDAGSIKGYFDPPLCDNGIRAVQRYRPVLNPFAHSTVTYKTDVVKDVGGYPLGFEMAEDYALWLRLAELGPMSNLPYRDSRVRIHLGQKTHGRRGLEVYSHVLSAHQQAFGARTTDRSLTIGRCELVLHQLALASRFGSVDDLRRIASENPAYLLAIPRHPSVPLRAALDIFRSRRRSDVRIDWRVA